MAKAHCDKHKRYVPTCVGCQSEALKETVGFPKHAEAEEDTPPADETASDVDEGVEHEGESDDEGGDIAEWEPEVEEEPVDEGALAGEAIPIPTVAPPAPLPGYKPRDIDETEEAMAAEGEFDLKPVAEIDGDGNVVLKPGEGEPEQGPTKVMEPIDVAMEFFPRRLIPEGATEVCDEERPDEPYMASYEELIRRAVLGYINVGLEPADAAIVVAGEVVQAEKMLPDFGEGAEEDDEAFTAVSEEAFDAGLEAAPEMTGCIEDYNQGFNAGMKALREALRTYYAGDEDAPAYSLGLWLDKQIVGMRK